MKILIAAYYFPPQNTPRAFRAYELARQFVRMGHEVHLFIPGVLTDPQRAKCMGWSEHPVGRSDRQENNVTNPVNIGGNNAKSKQSSSMFRTIRNLLRLIYLFLIPGGRTFWYSFSLFRAVNKEFPADMILSISLPFSTHLGCSWLSRKKWAHPIMIADCGDPFSKNMESFFFPHYHLLEKLVLRRFDYVVIPTEKARDTYRQFVADNKIQVIPQGVNFKDYPLQSFTPGPVPRFAYAGIFYKTIRNPDSFLTMISQVDRPFQFIIYTDVTDDENMAMLNPHRSVLKERLVIHPLIPRRECIRELSNVDFLINFENTSNNQSPSKLIDYGLSGRPVLTINQTQLDIQKFIDFLSSDYSSAENIDIEQFSIEVVATDFLNLNTLMPHVSKRISTSE